MIPVKIITKASGPTLHTRVVMVCVLVVCGLFLAYAANMTPSSANALFAKANTEYQQQKYADARNTYAELIKSGVQSPELFYNMGNACARLDKTGEAVLYYERARKLSPHDLDIRANLKKLAPADNDPAHFILFRPFFWVVEYFSLRGWLATFFAFYVLAGVVGTVALAWPAHPWSRWLRPGFYVIGAVAVFIGVFALTRYYQDTQVDYAIVMKSGLPIYSGPSTSFSQIISAPEGTKVRRLSFGDPSWAQVMLLDGQKGFARADNLSEI